MLGLPQLLGDDLRGGLRIQEAVPDDLADDLVGSTIIGFGASGFAEQSDGALLQKAMAQLEIALLGIAEFASRRQGAQAVAVALEEHREFEGDFVIGQHRQGAGGAREGGKGVLGESDHNGKVRGEGQKV